MTIQRWSDDIIVADLCDDPQFTDEMASLAQMLSERAVCTVLNLSAVSYLNSSNIARLLRMRKQLQAAGKPLLLCAVNTHVWGEFLVTGLEKVFDFTNDVATALARAQLSGV